MDGDAIVDRFDFEAEDDSEALALLALRREKLECDLWCGDRLVATIPSGANPVLAGRSFGNRSSG
ncbi:hypothetical protein [Sphingomonas sp. SRS2]|uniref:hypothetical protein n=1 Tax=Sphingomonas sp. SRS2 TaxID=133190 RepID=UPI00061EA085|nr:hypothetical protein [Sphingomonas sp. SRS2]KKC27738.1 hypothetical protein WP12_01705 [Sphingomonas sp. SRS2]